MQNHTFFQTLHYSICIFIKLHSLSFLISFSFDFCIIVSFIFETVYWPSTATEEISALSSLFCSWLLELFPAFLLPKKPPKKLQNSLWKSCDPMRYFCLDIINKQRNKIKVSQSLIPCISVLYGEGNGVFEKLKLRWHESLAQKCVCQMSYNITTFHISSRSKMHPCTILICTQKCISYVNQVFLQWAAWLLFIFVYSCFAFKKNSREV